MDTNFKTERPEPDQTEPKWI